MLGHHDIRIGTLTPIAKGADYIRQILPYGFESFQPTAFQSIGEVDLQRLAKETLEVVGDRAVISSLSCYGNPLQNPTTAADIIRLIDAAESFNCRMVCSFAGAIDGKPLEESLSAFRAYWGEVIKRAEDRGVRIAWENCDMGGTWKSVAWNIAHNPAAWEILFNEFPTRTVGLEWEPTHQLGALVDPIAQLRKWMPTGRIIHVHGKDATVAWDVIREHGTRGPKQFVWHRTPGFGDTNWTDVISILRQNKYQGTIDIEGWHDPVYREDLEMTGQVYALNYLKRCRGGEFVPNPK